MILLSKFLSDFASYLNFELLFNIIYVILSLQLQCYLMMYHWWYRGNFCRHLHKSWEVWSQRLKRRLHIIHSLKFSLGSCRSKNRFVPTIINRICFPNCVAYDYLCYCWLIMLYTEIRNLY